MMVSDTDIGYGGQYPFDSISLSAETILIIRLSSLEKHSLPQLLLVFL